MGKSMGKRGCSDGDKNTPCNGSLWIVLYYDKTTYIEVVKTNMNSNANPMACLEYDYNSDLIDK